MTPKTETLAFFLVDETVDQFRDAIVESLEAFFASRVWSHSPPTVIVSANPDEDDYRIGGFLELYSARDQKLDRALDMQAFNDVVSLINFLEDISRRYLLDTDIEIDGDLVGSISDGNKSKTLVIGLLEPWQQRLEG